MFESFSRNVQLIECPRDAMQGWKNFIPTETKIRYLNALLQVGFHTLDCGSFVSPKHIPQMSDTRDVIGKLSMHDTRTKLLVIVVNRRGAQEALQFDNISYLGYPFSISPTFQQRNANSTIEESLHRLDEIQELCLQHQRELVVYLSMAFGNPYNDDYDEETLLYWADEMVKRNIKIVSLADTVGLATTQQINFALDTLIPAYPQAQFGVHLHSYKQDWQSKLEAALESGCKRYDGALLGIGGCPMATNELVGNMDTKQMISFFTGRNLLSSIDEAALNRAIEIAYEVFRN